MSEENYLPVNEAVNGSFEIENSHKLTIVWDIGRMSDLPIGGVGVYKDREVLFLHSTGDIYYIFDVHPEDMELFKREQNYYRAANGFLRDYGFGYDRRFEFNYKTKKFLFYRPSYEIGKFRVKVVAKIGLESVDNIYPHIVVDEKYRSYFSDALNHVIDSSTTSE